MDPAGIGAVGVDIDGVIADQVAGVLNRVNRRENLNLTREDVDEYDARLTASVTFKAAIDLAFESQGFVLDMPVHKGAGAMLARLTQSYKVVLVTSRPLPSRTETIEWLRRHDLSYHELQFLHGPDKWKANVSVLIEDHTPTLEHFVAKTRGSGVLVDQPWNRDKSHRKRIVAGGRISVANSLEEAGAQAIAHLSG